MNATTTGETVQRRYTYDECVAFIKFHSGHYTTGPAVRICGELAETPGQTSHCWQPGHAHCTVSYDAGEGMFWVRASRAEVENFERQVHFCTQGNGSETGQRLTAPSHTPDPSAGSSAPPTDDTDETGAR